MPRPFLDYDPEQSFLLPPSMRDWLAPDHLVYMISDLVDSLDLSHITSHYTSAPGGAPPHDPRMMTKIWLYAYTQGVLSSRKVQKRLHEDVAFRVLAANNTPNWVPLSRFRKRHLGDLAQLFLQALRVCQEAGLVKMGHVALDGTKVKANASKHKAMSYARMKDEEERLRREIEETLRKGVALDEQEDERYGDKQGDELPPELADREERLRRIRNAIDKLEREARERGGPDAVPKPKTQYNFTDPESRIMPLSNNKNAFDQQYNAQLVVDETAHVVVACGVSNVAPDQHHLPRMVDEVERCTGALPVKLSADAGYYSDENVDLLDERGIDAYVTPDRKKHGRDPPGAPRGRIPDALSEKDRMRRKLATVKGRAEYAKRKGVVEPVIGLVKRVLGFRRFSLRGLRNAGREWAFVLAAYNVMVLFWSKRRAAAT